MVCDRCKLSVGDILSRLQIPYSSITLGEVELERSLNPTETETLEEELSKIGFALVLERNERIVSKIKSVIIEAIYDEDSLASENLSEVLSKNLNYDYSHLTSIFRKQEGQSIQSFQNKLRAERIKELLEYDELNISEIADKLGYGSAAYLSTFFKKITGLTPSQYRLQQLKDRNSIDSV